MKSRSRIGELVFGGDFDRVCAKWGGELVFEIITAERTGEWVVVD